MDPANLPACTSATADLRRLDRCSVWRRPDLFPG
jgi:hypothetical protein